MLFADLASIKVQLVPWSAPPLTAADLLAGRLALLIPTLGVHKMPILDESCG